MWRGSESRKNLEYHVKSHYDELSELVKNGIVLNIDGVQEHFNVLSFLVADLSFVKEVLGKCSCMQTYGCFHCELNIKKWDSVKKVNGTEQSIVKMKARGERAVQVIGVDPDKNSSKYKNFTMSNFGQWVCAL